MTTPNQNPSAVIPRSEKSFPTSVKGWLTSDYFRQQVALCLPKHLTADRFMRVALTALMRIPKLEKCTPQSVMRCMMTCSELGLEPDGRRAHLIPFENRKQNTVECTLIIDYKGLVELAKRSGDVSNIHADIVCEKDEFEVNRGALNTHVVDYRKPRGQMYAAYALIRFKDGSEKCEVMTKDEIDSIRARSRASGAGPWVTDYNEMAKKTVFRRASKWITLSPELADALDKEDDSNPGSVSLVEEASGMIEPPATTISAEVENPPTSSDDGDTRPATDAPPADKPRRGRPPKQPEASPEPPQTQPEVGDATPQGVLAKVVIDAGFNFDLFQKWGVETGNIEAKDADSMGSFQEVPTKLAERLLRARVGLVAGLAKVKKGEAV